MIISCWTCKGTGSVAGVSCPVCGGDGEVDLLDEKFKQIEVASQLTLMGQVWSTILTNQADMADKLDNIMDKCNDIFEKVNE